MGGSSQDLGGSSSGSSEPLFEDGWENRVGIHSTPVGERKEFQIRILKKYKDTTIFGRERFHLVIEYPGLGKSNTLHDVSSDKYHRAEIGQMDYITLYHAGGGKWRSSRESALAS